MIYILEGNRIKRKEPALCWRLVQINYISTKAFCESIRKERKNESNQN